MTRRRLLRSHLRGMTIAASICFLKLLELFFDSNHLGVGRLLVVFVARGTGCNGHVRRQFAHGRGARNVDVTRGAFHYVLALTAFVAELCRDAFGRQQRHKCARSLVTAGAVLVDGLLICPVAAKTGIVTTRHGLEKFAGLIGWVRGWCDLSAYQLIVTLMTDSAVVVVDSLVVGVQRE